MVVLGGETGGTTGIRGGFLSEAQQQYTRGFSERAGGTARQCVDERLMLGWTHDAHP
jgi:hypothetical protein